MPACISGALPVLLPNLVPRESNHTNQLTLFSMKVFDELTTHGRPKLTSAELHQRGRRGEKPAPNSLASQKSQVPPNLLSHFSRLA